MTQSCITSCIVKFFLTLLHSERPKLYTILAFLSAIGLKCEFLNGNRKGTDDKAPHENILLAQRTLSNHLQSCWYSKWQGVFILPKCHSIGPNTMSL